MTLRELLTRLAAERSLPADLPARAAAVLATPRRDQTPWYLHLLVATGSWIAALLLLVFTAMLGVISSSASAILIGAIVVGAAIGLRYLVDRVTWLAQVPLALSTVGALLIFGGVFALGNFADNTSLNRAIGALCVVELLLIAVYPDPLRRLLSALVLAVALCWLPLLNGLPLIAQFVVVTLGWAVALLWRGESWMARHEALLRPVAYGLVFGLFGGLLLLLTEPAPPRMVTSLGLAAALAVVVWSLTLAAGPPTRLATMAGALLLLIPAWQTPGILAAALVLVLGFSRGNRLLLGLGALFLAGFIAFFYYSLATTLLVKSYALIGAGLLLLALRAGLLHAAARSGLL